MVVDLVGSMEKAVGLSPGWSGMEGVHKWLFPVFDVVPFLGVQKYFQGDQLSLSATGSISLSSPGAVVPVGKIWHVKYLSCTVTVIGTKKAGWQHGIVRKSVPSGFVVGGGCGMNDPVFEASLAAGLTAPVVLAVGTGYAWSLDLWMAEGDEFVLSVNVVDATEKVASNVVYIEFDVV